MLFDVTNSIFIINIIFVSVEQEHVEVQQFVENVSELNYLIRFRSAFPLIHII